MFDLRRIPIVKVLLPFAGGSLAGHCILHPHQEPELLVATAVMWIFQLAVFHWNHNSGDRQCLFFLLTCSLLFLVGFATGTLTRPVDPDLPLGEKVMIRGVITRGPIPGTKYWSYEMETESLCCRDSYFGIRTQLKIYMTSLSDTLPGVDSLMPGEGEAWQFFGQLAPIKNSGNPGATDFKAILNRNNCWYRFYSDLSYNPRMLKKPVEQKGLGYRHIHAARIRNAVSDHWSGNGNEISLLKAVCLGDRSDLTNELKEAYSNAGAMHLLAVSGLHMGLIWWVLYHLFAWMVRLSGREIFRSLSIIAILWIFAFVTGFSSSVARSATMFTLFTAGRLMCQRMHAMNGIFVSAFLLILINPSRMLDVGFQLSYAAIMGIVAFYPVLRQLLSIKNRVLRRIWEGTLISFTAQISTAPLVIYYFHQIPVYSLITSLVTIPLLSLLIAFFVISVPFMVAGIWSFLFNGVLIKLAFLINFSVEWVASIPGGVVTDLNLHTTMLCLWMGIICTMMVILNHRMALARYLLIGLLSASLCWAARVSYLRTHSSELVIGHFNHASIITFREGKKVDHYCLYRDSAAFHYLEQYTSQNWCSRSFQTSMIELVSMDSVKGAISACNLMTPGVWLLGNDWIKGWIISGTTELLFGFGADFVLLTGNPPLSHISLELLNSSGEVILDGSNRNWYMPVIEQYKEENMCLFKAYKTGEHGAYLKRW